MYDCLKVGYELNAKMDIDVWHNRPAQIAMDEGLKAKFGQNAHLRIFLLGTGNKKLVETSQRDLHWGYGIALKDHAKLLDINN